MTRQPLFSGLVFDENDNPVDVTFVGDEPFYVVDDAGFLRHIPSEHVDRQVLEAMRELIDGHEDALSEKTAKMLGQEGALLAGEELVNPIAEDDADALTRGAFVYNTFCVVCHGAAGLGNGVATKRGVPPPPSLLAERAVKMTDGRNRYTGRA